MRVVRAGFVAVVVALAVAGCGSKPEPAPAELRTSAPPWDAPRDAVSYVDAAGMERLPLDFRGPAPYYIKIVVTVDGAKIVVPANIGVDLIRAEQAPLHTHGTDGIVNIEAKTRTERPTLKQFFTLWGVRYDEKCLGDACGGVTVLVNGDAAPWDSPLPREALVLVAVKR